MKKLIALAGIVIALAACTGAPTAPEVQAIQNACAVDAGLRPSVSALLIFATPAEVTAIQAARAVIDPICANPSGTPSANAISAITAATAQVISIKTAIDQRRAPAS